jgi:hypothetical protein
MKPDIYLDIDGVLLANDLQPALHAREFLHHVINTYPTYWLTTHCKGDASTAVRRLAEVFDDETVQLLGRIKATEWDLCKTEGIDFDQPFLWFDDDLFHGEREDLLMHGAMDNWIQVDLRKNPAQLQDFLTSFPLATVPQFFIDHHLGAVPMDMDGPSPWNEEQQRILQRKIKEFEDMYRTDRDRR